MMDEVRYRRENDQNILTLISKSIKDAQNTAIPHPLYPFIMPFCGGGRRKTPEKVSFLPQWSPQAQFAGYYVAFERGFYRNHE